MQALHEPLAGILFPDQCITAHTLLAERYGAELHFDERVTGWSSAASPSGGAAPNTVTTSAGTYEADKLVICAGAWLPKEQRPQEQIRM